MFSALSHHMSFTVSSMHLCGICYFEIFNYQFYRLLLTKKYKSKSGKSDSFVYLHNRLRMIGGNALFRYTAPKFGRVPLHFLATFSPSPCLSLEATSIDWQKWYGQVCKISKKNRKAISIYESEEQNIKQNNRSLIG